MSKRTSATFLALALLCAINTASAQDGGKSLHWRRLDVDARLDADGRLRVRERQAMVFNGEWNGGSRTFNVRPGQRLELHGIARIDAAGATHPLRSGDTDAVDGFAWIDGSTVRWRSRQPSDPAFVNQEIVYELDYSLSRILIARGEEYVLDHDFTFPDREGEIESFTLEFDAAGVWQSASLPLRLERQNISPGASVVVNVPLLYTGSGTPAGVQRSVALSMRLLLALMLAAGFGWMLRAFFADEHARGRFAPLTPTEAIDAAWLRDHVFSMPPEVVGAMWDDSTAAPEVAAMIARMVQEGKLASRVEPKKRKQVLHLELKVQRADLGPEERRLVNALFSSGRNTTDTERIRERYSSSGFDPAALIREGIEKQIKARSPSAADPARVRNVLINTVVAVIVAGSALSILLAASNPPVFTTPILVCVAGFVALGVAAAYRGSVVATSRNARVIVAFLLLAVAPVLAIVLGLFEAGALLSVTSAVVPPPGVPLLAVLVVLFLGIAFLVLRAARTREDPERLELRRTLAAGRAFFMHELKQSRPALEDDWYPYLVAFGLGSHIDGWFRAFGARAREQAPFTSSSFGGVATESSGSWSGGGPLFGGGGGFGGGGTGRTWASAASTFAAGVSAPSSDSGGGGGGGGGGGSSGGGGGGGW